MSVLRRDPAHSNTGAVVLVFAVVAALYFARDILIPLAFALTLTFLLTPAVTFLEKLRLGRVLPVILTVLVSMAAAGWITWIIANQLVDVASRLPTYRQNIHAKIEALRNGGKGALGRAADSAQDIGREISGPDTPAIASTPSAQNQKQRNAPRAPKPPVPVQIVPTPTSGLADLPDLVRPFLAPLGRAGMVLLFAIFMLVKREDLRNRLLRLVGLGQLNMMTQALDDAAQRVSRYLFMQFLVNAGFGILSAIGLYLIGVPNPVLWGVLAAIFRLSWAGRQSILPLKCTARVLRVRTGDQFAGPGRRGSRAKARFERSQPDRLLTSLAEALEQIGELVSPQRSCSAERQSATVYTET